MVNVRKRGNFYQYQFEVAPIDGKRKLDSINAELKINDDDHEILGDEQEEKDDKNKDKNIISKYINRNKTKKKKRNKNYNPLHILFHYVHSSLY